MTDTTLLIDGDILAYQAAAVLEKPVDWGDGLWTLHVHYDEAVSLLEDKLQALKDTLECDKAIIALTDGRSFRYDVLPTYKANRKATRKPLVLGALKEHLLQNHNTYLRPRLEGDDILGILMTSKTIVPGVKIQVSLDKDQRQIPGLLYNPGTQTLTDISVKEADQWHAIQTLAGDATDGYAGCPGMGIERATAAVEGMVALEVYPHRLVRGPRAGQLETRTREVPGQSLWHVITSHFVANGLGEEEALRQARVARILRNTDYDFTRKEPKLWTPTTTAIP